jgi:tellurite resistance protein
MSRDPFSGPRDDYPSMREGDAGVLAPTMMMAMVMTALADGDLGQREKDALVEVYYSGHRRDMSPQAALARLQEIVRLTKHLGEKLWPKMLEGARGLSAPSKLEVLHVCATTARLDGPVCPEEERMIESIATWIGVERDAFETWRVESLHTSKEGEG